MRSLLGVYRSPATPPYRACAHAGVHYLENDFRVTTWSLSSREATTGPLRGRKGTIRLSCVSCRPAISVVAGSERKQRHFSKLLVLAKV